MIVVRVLFIVLLLASQAMKAHGAEHYYNDPFSTDSRIKTYIFNPNDVYLLVLHYGFQSHVEFAKNETIETITLGDSYAWKITPLGNRLFIKPMERNIRTNMTIITNKRVYQFDLVAKELEENSDGDQDMVYVVRFEYPKRSRD
jgi:type IV secretion system protein VirB9